MNTDISCRDATNSCKIVSEYFLNNPVMDGRCKEIKEKQSTSKKSQAKAETVRKRPNKRAKGQKDIRALIKSKKSDLITYTKDFDLICKQSGIDVDPDQLQLAIALSKSLQDNNSTDNDNRKNTEKSLTCNQRRSKIRTTLQEYGFKTKKEPSKKVKKYRKHYNLLLVADAEKQQRIADKYAQILIRNVCIYKTNEEFPNKKDNISSYLYNLTTNVSYNSLWDDEIFYINDLVPKSLHKKHIFKDWSKIPGRPVSPKLERPDQSVIITGCSQEELDILLSGTIERAQYTVKKNYRNNSFKFDIFTDIPNTETEINIQNSIQVKSKEYLTEVTCDNKIIEENSITSKVDEFKYSNTNTMSQQINRSCSPDLFDDEVTIIMDYSKDKISVPEGVMDRTMMLKEQNDVMELTDCVSNINGNYNTASKQITYLSQDVTRSNSNYFMDLTECVPVCSQNNLNNFITTCNSQKDDKNCTIFKKSNHIEIIELNQRSNFINNIKPSSSSNEKSLDDTIIIVTEDYNNDNTGNKCNVVRSTFKDNIFIDLIENEYECSKIVSTMDNHSDSTDKIEKNPDKNIGNDFNKSYSQVNNSDNGSPKSTLNPYKLYNKEDNGLTKSNEHLETVDLTQVSNFEDCSSIMNGHTRKSVVAYETDIESDGISSNTAHVRRSSDLNKVENESYNERDNDQGLEKCKYFEKMDLTQSSNSEDCLTEIVDEVCSNNQSLHFTMTLNDEYHNSTTLFNNELESIDKETGCIILYDGRPEQDKNYSKNLIIEPKAIKSSKTNTITNISNFLDNDNDREFDNLVEYSRENNRQTCELYEDKDLIKGNSFSLPDNSTSEHECNNREIDLTQSYNCSIDQLSAPNNLTHKTDKMNDDVHRLRDFNDDCCIIDVEGVNTKNFESNKKGDESQNSEIALTTASIKQSNIGFDGNHDYDHICEDISRINQCSIVAPKFHCGREVTRNTQYENVLKDDHDIQNNDIDLTQRSDTSEDALNIIEVPEELGKRNNVSIDYDEVCNESNITEECKTSFSRDINKFVGKDKSDLQDDRISGSSQHSEVFVLSDNEFDYSINQYVKENDSLTLKQRKFDIGGISIIDEFLNRNSLSRRSKLRCSCNSNDELNSTRNKVESCFPEVTVKNNEHELGNVNGESKSCEEIQFVKIVTPTKSRSDENILIAKTPRHNDYIIKTDQVTPMPKYEDMSSPERNEELDKFGIKPLKRKRAIQILTHLYNQTHPLMELISSDDCSSPSKIKRRNDVECFPRRVSSSQTDSITADRSAKSSNHILEIVEPNLSQKTSTSCKSKKSQKSPEKSRTWVERAKRSSKENNLYEETTFKPDIRDIECSPEEWVFQKREKAKVHSCRVPLHIAFHNYVSSRRPLREAILKYEPINIDDIHKGLVSVGYRYNPKDLLKFMDRKCITVKTADSSRKNKDT